MEMWAKERSFFHKKRKQSVLEHTDKNDPLAEHRDKSPANEVLGLSVFPDAFECIYWNQNTLLLTKKVTV